MHAKPLAKFKLWKNTSANLEGLPLQFHFHPALRNIVLYGPSAQLFPRPTQTARTGKVRDHFREGPIDRV